MTLKLTKDDVGKKFRRRDGKIVTVEVWDGTSSPIQTSDGLWRYADQAKSLWQGDEALIERITEEPVNEFNWDKFNEVLGRSTNICGGAKKDIERAIAAGKGEKRVEPKAGQVWKLRVNTSPALLVPKTGRSSDFSYVLLNEDGSLYNWTTLGPDYVKRAYERGDAELLANSLQEYLANGGTL